MGHRLTPARLVLALTLSLTVSTPLAAQEPAGGQIADETRDRLMDRLRLLDPERQREALEADTAAMAGRTGVGVGEKATAAGAGREPAPARAGLPASGAPSDAPAELEGYTATDYQGAGAHYDAAEGTIRLLGPSRVTRGGNSVTADSVLVLDLGSMLLCGYGRPVLSGEEAAEPVESEQVCYDVDRQIGEARDARTRFTQGATWIVRGERVYPVGSDRIYSHKTLFTDCEEEEPHYHFAAEQVKVIANDVLVARNVTLNFRDVPVLWLPFMVQSLKDGRRSGLLTPRFGINDLLRNQSSYSRRISNVGYYWAINEYMGAELALDWFSGHWTALEGAFEYNWAKQFLSGNLTVRRFWQESGSKNLTLNTANTWRMDERTTLSVSGAYTSSTDFVRREARDPMELNRTINSTAGLNRRFDWGRVSLGATRRQYLGDDRVEMTLPEFGLNISPITFFAASALDARWYNNATWSANVTGRSNSVLHPDTIPDRRTTAVSATSSFTLGSFGWSQSASFNEQARMMKGVAPDSVTRQANWNMGISYQQRLIGTTTLTPGVQMSGEFRSDPRQGGQLVASPTRLSFNTALSTALFGFWPGVGPFSAFRHRISPSVSYSYAPGVVADSVQKAVFGVDEIREQNRIEIRINQTIEAKLRSETRVDTAAVDTLAASAAPGEPIRLPRARTITLLSLTTSAVAYDFVKAREDAHIGGRFPGLVTRQLSNTVSSDLLRGINLSFTHDLIEEIRGENNQVIAREFSPHLSTVNASMELGQDSWLARLIGAAVGLGSASLQQAPEAEEEPEAEDEELGAGTGLELVGSRRRAPGRAQPSLRTGTGGFSWRLSLSYSLNRPRGMVADSRLTSRANFTFRPTPGWTVRWSTGYSFTEGDFSDHILSFVRDMHDWTANFDFVRAQNGNFTFQFHVQLKSRPEIKFDYEQRSDPLR